MMTFKRQMLLLLASVGLIPMVIVSFVTILTAERDMERQIFDQLGSLYQYKEKSLTTFFDRLTTEVELLAVNPELRQVIEHFDHAYSEAHPDPAETQKHRAAVQDFYLHEFLPRLQQYRPQAGQDVIDGIVQKLSDKDLWFQYRYITQNPHAVGSKDQLESSGADDEYDRYHQELHDYLRSTIREYGFYDLFLINVQGEVLYSVFKEIDFATSLTHGPFADSALAEAFQAANQAEAGTVILTDFHNYLPSYDAPAGFIAAPLLNLQGQHIGVVAAQFPVDALSKLISGRRGMGKTGESLLLGPDHLLRTDSQLDPEKHSVLQSFLHPEESRIDTEAARRALADSEGEDILVDYLGHRTLVSYGPFRYHELHWALLVKKNTEEAFAVMDHLKMVSTIVVGIALVLILVIAIVFTRLALRPLGAEPKVMQRIVQKIADGDLTVEVPAANPGSVAESMRAMVTGLKKIIAEINSGADQLQAISHQLAAATEQTSQALQEQTSHTSQMATAIYEMTESFREVGDNILAAANASGSSRHQIAESTSEVNHSSDALHRVADEFKASARTVDQLTQRVSEITGVLTTIEAIAEQTNLLALNAAIEAARAGEHGRGFSVVAEEVRALARNTQRETERIATIIHSLKSEADTSQRQMRNSVVQAEEVCEQSTHTTGKLKAAAVSLDEVSQMTNGIASAAEEQNQVATGISANVEALSSALCETERAIEEIAQSATIIADGSAKLHSMVQHFRV